MAEIFRTIAQSKYFELVFNIVTAIAIALLVIFIANTAISGLDAFDIVVLVLQILAECGLIGVFIAYWVLKYKQ